MRYEGMQSAQFMGLINAMRTGDPVVDMILAFLVPLLVQKIIVHLPAEIQKLTDKLLKKKKEVRVCYQRNIVYRSVCNAATNVRLATDEDTFNMYLLRAIHLYTHQHCELKELCDAHLDLTMLDTSQTNSRTGRFQPNNGSSNGSNSIVDMLQTCSLVEKPLENKWLQVGNYCGGGVEIMICDSAANKGGSKTDKQAQINNGGSGGEGTCNSSKSESTRSLEIKIRSYHSVDSIHIFVKTAFDWYVEEIKKQENKDRFMLDVMPMAGGGRHGTVPQYVPYKLHDGKTFKTLFNRKCQELLRVVDQFQEKNGKYAIEGYPYKLGLLLSGPPGTGKTSLIKALAHYTNRHIVNINLAHISANSDLRKIFFNKTYQITSPNGAQHYMRLDFNQVIFVLEDVDAGAREVVMDRSLLAEIEKEKAEKEAKKKEEEKNQPAFAGGALRHRPTTGSSFPGLDKLNLSGLLNVLDGVVETPGRMVIMTTNHPEILDPALIRPGRIDKILELGFMEEPDDVIAMLEHYYPGRPLSPEERAKVKTCLADGRVQITPAQMEQIAMEEDALAGFLDRFSNYNKVKDIKSGIPKRFVIHSPESTDTANTSDYTPTEDEEVAFALEELLQAGDY